MRLSDVVLPPPVPPASSTPWLWPGLLALVAVGVGWLIWKSRRAAQLEARAGTRSVPPAAPARTEALAPRDEPRAGVEAAPEAEGDGAPMSERQLAAMMAMSQSIFRFCLDPDWSHKRATVLASGASFLDPFQREVGLQVVETSDPGGVLREVLSFHRELLEACASAGVAATFDDRRWRERFEREVGPSLRGMAPALAALGEEPGATAIEAEHRRPLVVVNEAGETIFRHPSLGFQLRLPAGFEPLELPDDEVAARLGAEVAARSLQYGFVRSAAVGLPTLLTLLLERLDPTEEAEQVLDRIVEGFAAAQTDDAFRLRDQATSRGDEGSERWMQATIEKQGLELGNEGRFLVMGLGAGAHPFVVSVTAVGPPGAVIAPLLLGFGRTPAGAAATLGKLSTAGRGARGAGALAGGERPGRPARGRTGRSGWVGGRDTPG